MVAMARPLQLPSSKSQVAIFLSKFFVTRACRESNAALSNVHWKGLMYIAREN